MNVRPSTSPLAGQKSPTADTHLIPKAKAALSALQKQTKMIPEQSLRALFRVFKRDKDEATFKTILSIIYTRVG